MSSVTRERSGTVTATFSHWGEPVNLEAPMDAIPIAPSEPAEPTTPAPDGSLDETPAGVPGLPSRHRATTPSRARRQAGVPNASAKRAASPAARQHPWDRPRRRTPPDPLRRWALQAQPHRPAHAEQGEGR